MDRAGADLSRPVLAFGRDLLPVRRHRNAAGPIRDGGRAGTGSQGRGASARGGGIAEAREPRGGSSLIATTSGPEAFPSQQTLPAAPPPGAGSPPFFLW